MSSPQVNIIEKVLETIPAVRGGLTAVIIGTANKGKFEEITLTNSRSTFREIWGTQTQTSWLNYATKKYLVNSGNLYVARAGDQTAAVKSSAVINDSANPSETLMTFESLTAGEDGDNVSVVTTKLDDVSGEPTSYTVQIKYNGLVEETYRNVNLDSSDTDNFIEERINGISAYVEVSVEDSLPAEPLIDDDEYDLTGGNNGDEGAGVLTSINNILELLKDKDKYTFDIVIVPDYSFNPTVSTKLNELVTYRNDCASIIDAPQGIGLLAPSSAVSSAVDFTDGEAQNSIKLDNKNLFHFSYWQQDYDDEDSTYKYIPPSIYVLAKMAEVARNGVPWNSIAGVSSGRLSTVDTEFSPSKDQRDILYGEQLNGKVNVVNPIIKDNVDGMLIWGQRTTERSLLPTNRINVVMMLNFAKQRLYRIGKRLQFSINNEDLWNRFAEEAGNLFAYIQSNYGVERYTVVSDATTNTPTVRANNRFLGKIKLWPSSLAEDIDILLEVTPQNISVS